MIIGSIILGLMFIALCAVIAESIIRDVEKGKF
jgi:hypothetical protein